MDTAYVKFLQKNVANRFKNIILLRKLKITNKLKDKRKYVLDT